MEKFGIFELLDTLSALVSSTPDMDFENSGAKSEAFTHAAPVNEAAQSDKTDNGETVRPNSRDAAFLAPDYGIPVRSAQSEENAAAIGKFLERHDNLSKKIDENE